MRGRGDGDRSASIGAEVMNSRNWSGRKREILYQHNKLKEQRHVSTAPMVRAACLMPSSLVRVLMMAVRSMTSSGPASG